MSTFDTYARPLTINGQTYMARVWRLCQHCGRMQSYGNFMVKHNRKRTFISHVCRWCLKPRAVDGTRITRRTNLTLTDEGRTYLAAEAEAA